MSSHSTRLSFIFVEFVGQVVNAHLTDGSVVEGIFATYNDEEGSVLLLKARRTIGSIDSLTSELKAEDALVINFKHITHLQSSYIREDTSLVDRVKIEKIGRSLFQGERELMNWADDVEENDTFLDDEKHHHAGQWDQFKGNEHLIQGSSSYHERYYTTEIPKSLTQEQIEHANRIAREIEGGKSLNFQHAVDRGESLAQDYDEETLHSSVIRAGGIPAPAGARGNKQPQAQQRPAASVKLPPPSATAYVPPSMRGAPVPAGNQTKKPLQAPNPLTDADIDPSINREQAADEFQQQVVPNSTGQAPSPITPASNTKRLNPNAKEFVFGPPGSGPAQVTKKEDENPWRPSAVQNLIDGPGSLVRHIASRLIEKASVQVQPATISPYNNEFSNMGYPSDQYPGGSDEMYSSNEYYPNQPSYNYGYNMTHSHPQMHHAPPHAHHMMPPNQHHPHPGHPGHPPQHHHPNVPGAQQGFPPQYRQPPNPGQHVPPHMQHTMHQHSHHGHVPPPPDYTGNMYSQHHHHHHHHQQYPPSPPTYGGPHGGIPPHGGVPPHGRMSGPPPPGQPPYHPHQGSLYPSNPQPSHYAPPTVNGNPRPGPPMGRPHQPMATPVPTYSSVPPRTSSAPPTDAPPQLPPYRVAPPINQPAQPLPVNQQPQQPIPIHHDPTAAQPRPTNLKPPVPALPGKTTTKSVPAPAGVIPPPAAPRPVKTTPVADARKPLPKK